MSATAVHPEPHSGEPRLALDPDVNRAARGALAALLSTLKDHAGELWCGAALGGAFAAGEGEAENGVLVDRFELLAVLAAPLHDLETHARKLRRAAETTARSRRVRVRVEAASREALRFLPATLENLSCLAAGRVVDGPPDLLFAARPTASGVAPEEGLRLLVRAGGRLLSAGHDLDSTASANALRGGLRAARSADLACADAVLVSAGRYTPCESARDAALRALAGDGGGEAAGIHRRMTWTRFHDLVDAQRQPREPAAAGTGEARKRLAHATDRWLEVLRFFEEARLGRELQSWSAYAGALADLRSPRAASLFELLGAEAGLTRRDARRWPACERLAAAVASLLDWDPGDLPLAPVLLDLPDGSPRGALVSRAAAWAGDV